MGPILTRDYKARLVGLLTIDAATGRSDPARLHQSGEIGVASLFAA
jgi:hypothetical protein